MAHSDQTRATIQSLFDAITSRDQAAFRQLLADDVSMINPATGERVEGADAVTASVWAMAEAFPDLRPEITALIADGEYGVAETLRIGTHQGEIRLPQGTVPPTGKTICLPECIIFRICDGKALEMRVHTDRLAAFEQLGLT